MANLPNSFEKKNSIGSVQHRYVEPSVTPEPFPKKKEYFFSSLNSGIQFRQSLIQDSDFFHTFIVRHINQIFLTKIMKYELVLILLLQMK